MDEAEYFKERLDDQIDWYDRKSIWNKKWFHRLQLAQIVTGALIPFVALQVRVTHLNLDLVVGLLGMIVAVAGGVATLHKFQELWIEYRTTSEALKHEKFMYQTQSGPYSGANPFSALVERAEALMSQQHSRWVGLAKAKTEPAEPDAGGAPQS